MLINYLINLWIFMKYICQFVVYIVAWIFDNYWKLLLVFFSDFTSEVKMPTRNEAEDDIQFIAEWILMRRVFVLTVSGRLYQLAYYNVYMASGIFSHRAVRVSYLLQYTWYMLIEAWLCNPCVACYNKCWLTIIARMSQKKSNITT